MIISFPALQVRNHRLFHSDLPTHFSQSKNTSSHVILPFLPSHGNPAITLLEDISTSSSSSSSSFRLPIGAQLISPPLAARPRSFAILCALRIWSWTRRAKPRPASKDSGAEVNNQLPFSLLTPISKIRARPRELSRLKYRAECAGFSSRKYCHNASGSIYIFIYMKVCTRCSFVPRNAVIDLIPTKLYVKCNYNFGGQRIITKA